MNAVLRRVGWLLLAACPAGVQADASSSDLQARAAWIRVAPPGAAVMAGFLTLHNAGASPRAVTSIESKEFEEIQIHEMSMRDGVMRMRPLARLEIAPHAQVELAPGGVHLMLFRPRRALSAGEKIELTLHLADGDALPVEFVVGDAAAE